MKQTVLLIVALLSALLGWCQSAGAPGFFTYQGIARTAGGIPITSATIGLKISILNDNGLAEYAEEFPTVQTSSIGNFVIRVGMGEHDPETAPFGEISWEEGLFQMQVEMKPPSSTSYILIGATDLRSVPYALFAEKAGNEGGIVTSFTLNNQNELVIAQENSSSTVDLSGIFDALTLELDNDQLSLMQSDNPLGESVDLSVYKEQLGIDEAGFLTINGSPTDVNLHSIIASQTALTYDTTDATLNLTNDNSVGLEALQQKLKLSGSLLSIVPFYDLDGVNEVLLNLGQGGLSPWEDVPGGIFYENQVAIGTADLSPAPAKLTVKGSQIVLNSSNVAVIENNPNYTLTTGANLGAASILRADDGSIRVLSSARSPGTGSSTQEAGSMTLFGDNGQPNVMLSCNSLTNNHGRIQLYNAEGKPRLTLIVDTLGSGRLVLFGQNGKRNVEMSSLLGAENPNHGSITLFGDSGTIADKRVELFVDSNGVGRINTYGANGKLNCSIGSHPDSLNFGQLILYNANEEPRAGFKYDYIEEDDGYGYVAFAQSKAFKMDYPGDPSKELWYCAVEGPEAGAYLRGSASLVDGAAQVEFPDHFQKTINHQTMTVYLSPSSGQSMGLAVVDKMEGGFKVKELHQGEGNYAFDWEVKAVRKGFENFEVVRNK